MGQQKVVVESIEAGAKDFIVKPFDEGRVLEAINRVLS
jgi:two-component system chemotaxis response regulator CheY